MNLYQVYPTTYDYCYFVFAKTANRAKSLCTHYNTVDEDYIDLRCRLLKKNVGGEETVVDHPLDKDYARVLAEGFKYIEEE